MRKVRVRLARSRGRSSDPGWRCRRRDGLSHDRRKWSPAIVRLFNSQPPRTLTRDQRRAIVRLVEHGNPDSAEVRAAVRRVMLGDLDARLAEPDPDVVSLLETGCASDRLLERLAERRVSSRPG